MKGNFQTRENLIEAFWKISSEKGVEKTKVSDIIKLAGYNRSTFYFYFQDINQLIEEVERELFDNIVSIRSLKSFNEISEEVNNIFKKDGEKVSLLLSEKGDPYFTRRLVDYLLSKAKKDFRVPADNLYFNYLLEYHLQGLVSIITLWFRNYENVDFNKLTGLILEIEESIEKIYLKRKLE